MTCREATDFIMDYLSGQLDGDIVSAFEHHLTRCAACRAYLASYQATMALGRDAFAADPGPEETVPEELVQTILEIRRR